MKEKYQLELKKKNFKKRKIYSIGDRKRLIIYYERDKVGG